MKKRIIGVAALMGIALSGMAQQVLPQDVAGDKEYAQICREYELKSENSIELLEAYMEKYPDSRHANRVEAMIASVYFDKGKYQEAVAVYRSCNLDALADKERDDAAFKLAMAYLKTGNLKEATVWFGLLRDLAKDRRSDGVYHLGYIDYLEGRYDSALEAFMSLERDDVYDELAPYYIGEIYLLRKEYRKADEVATDYLRHFSGHKGEAEMKRIQGEARYEMNDYLAAVPLLEGYAEIVQVPSRRALYALGMSHYHLGSFSKAVRVLGGIVSEKDALSQNAWLHLGLACLQLKDRNQARMAFEQASVVDYDLSVKEQALYNYALCIHETSYSPFAESVTVFERFLNEFPDSPYRERVNNYLVETYMNTRSYDAALKSIAKISNPDFRILEAKQKILFRLGTQAFANADFASARQYFDKSLEVGNHNEEVRRNAYYWRGESYYRLKDYSAATRDFRVYIEQAKREHGQEYGLGLYGLGYAYFKQKNYVSALSWFNRFVTEMGNGDRQMLADAYNRIGDCFFYARDFDAARKNYELAGRTDTSLGDYSLFQEGFVKGLQRDYTGKIQSLNRLITDYPHSSYMDDALYEQGRAFVMLEDNVNAINRYQILLEKFPQSHMARRAASEIAMLYYQDDKYSEAISAYKDVIRNYPGSEEAHLAQRDLRTIYIDLNKVDEYVDFISKVPGGVHLDMNEHDSLTYVAAERIYMRGEMAEAKNSFLRYLQTFPEGAFVLNANYYIGLIAYNGKDYESAALHLNKVLEYPNNPYSEEAMVMSADMAYQAKDYTRSLELYRLLMDKISTPERRQLVETGMLRSAAMLGDTKEIVRVSTVVLTDSKVAPELEREARYYRAKSLMSDGQIQHALADWEVLAKDTRDVFGAEAKYRLVQNLYDTGKLEMVEEGVFEFVDASTPHTYWLARSFILLSDTYSQLGRKMEARQYLISLQQNYQADDDIADLIKERLGKLDKENKK